MRHWLFALALTVLPAVAQAADWVALQANEPDDPDKAALRAWGFGQAVGQAIVAHGVTGLKAEPLQPFEGQRAVFNLVDGRAVGFTVRRARLGVRGVVPRTDGRVSIAAAVEVGRLPITVAEDGWRPALVDASASLRGPVHTTLRLGRFKVPTTDETLEAVHVTTDTISRSIVIRRLLAERDTRTGAPTGRASAFRDEGLQVSGHHLHERTELSWALFGGMGGVEAGRGDAIARLQVSRLLDGRVRDPLRPEISGWAWLQVGQRQVGDATVDRQRAGAGVQVRTDHLRIRSEGVIAQGVLTTGFSPPFAGSALTLSEDGRAWGATTLAMVRHQQVEAGLGWNHLDSEPDGVSARRIFDEISGLVQVDTSKTTRLDVEGMWRLGRAPDGSPDAHTILATMGPSLSVQLTVRLP